MNDQAARQASKRELLVATKWRVSTKSGSGGNGANCVEVGLAAGSIAIRDSKHHTGGLLAASPAEWKAFLSAIEQ